jgi:hypothetical protein
LAGVEVLPRSKVCRICTPHAVNWSLPNIAKAARTLRLYPVENRSRHEARFNHRHGYAMIPKLLSERVCEGLERVLRGGIDALSCLRHTP